MFNTENYLSPRTLDNAPADRSESEEADEDGLSGGLQYDIEGNVIEPEPEDQLATEPTLQQTL